MGMGEPLANYRAVDRRRPPADRPAPDGLGLSAAQHHRVDRRPGPGDATSSRPRACPVTLAVSLHAPDDELRDTLVPVNTRWKVAEVLDAARRYFERHRAPGQHRVRADPRHQRPGLAGRPARPELNRRGRGWVHVNLIPLNPTPGSKWTASDPRVERAFVERLRAHGVPITVRDTRGREIDGACGQLRVTVTA